MREAEIRTYKILNTLAEPGGIVIFGCGADRQIPTCELRQAFAIEQKIYNRSFETLSVRDALDAYQEAAAELHPETVLLHLGEDDLICFTECPSGFDQTYRELIGFIRSQNKRCRIAVVSLKNYDGDPQISKINAHLKYIAESEQCEYGDIAARKVWNPKAAMDAVSFVYSIGFVRPLKAERPLFDLVNYLFRYEI